MNNKNEDDNKNEPDFDLNELLCNQITKYNINIQSYNEIYKLVISTIKYHATIGKTCCIYRIPLFVIGCPIINNKECLDHIKKKLEEKHIKVNYVTNDTIFISWDIGDYLEKKKEVNINDEIKKMQNNTITNLMNKNKKIE